jgi:predicted transcriptional regulator of viral defense system
MNRVSLTADELEILETALIEYGAVVTFDQLSSLIDQDRGYARKRISKLARQGWLKRLKKGVYVLSDLSTRGTLAISHIAVVNILAEDAYISFETALQHHGLYDQLGTSIHSVSLKQYNQRTIDKITYHFIKTQPHYFYGWKSDEIDGQVVKIASIEKALVDLIQFHRTRYSTDLVLEKLLTASEDIRLEWLTKYTLKANLTTQRIMGFLLDFASMDSKQIHQAVIDRKSVSAISKSKTNQYNHKWKLYYDPYFEKYAHTKTDPAAA